MKKYLSIFFCCIVFNSFSQSTKNTEWAVTSSSVKFKIKNAGFYVDGTFSGLNAKIVFDPTKQSGNKIEATVESKSINTSNNSRDGHLKKAEYFDVDKFPKISMNSSQFVKDKNGSWIGLFKITIKGITKDVYVSFVFNEKNNSGTFKASFTINRLDFGVGETSMMLADKVIMNIEVNVIKK